MQNKTLNFELNSKDIKLKKLLEGDFLRLEALTISDANPNRNGSHFTKEAMEKAIPTFFDKPVLAYYNQNLGPDGDFMGHECPSGLQYDKSLDELYYDYNSPNSEIPIGTIRQNDSVELIEKDGLNWIKVTCVLWTKYNYKAVRSLLRSRGGKTKLSVEIEVLSSHEENGIEVIDEFQLDGFTLLGKDSKGNEIEEGIPGAHAIAIDFFNKQQQCLAFAYSALDNYNNKTTKEPDPVLNNEDVPVENEKKEQISMEASENTKEGGIQKMPLTMRAKIDLLQPALEQALCKEDEGCCCMWVIDVCDTFVYYEYKDQKFRCPYAITELGDQHEVMLDLSAQERVIPSWSVFVKEEFDHHEEGCCKCPENIIHELLKDEHEAIEHYNCAQKFFEEECPAIAKIMYELAEEEMTHIGELQVALQMINDEAEEHIEEGKEEAKDILIEEMMEEPEHEEEGMQKVFEEEKCESDDKDDVPVNVVSPSPDDEFESDEEDDDKDDDDDDDDDKDDDKDDKDDDDDKEDDKDDDDDEFCGNANFSNELRPNAEPLNVDVDGLPMSQIISDSTQNIKAPAPQTEPEKLGEANASVASVLKDVEEHVLTGDPDGTANEDGSPINPQVPVSQPDDNMKKGEKLFVSTVTVNGVEFDVESLLEKYNELAARFETMNNSIKEQKVHALIEFGEAFINKDEVADPEAKDDFIEQVKDKCEKCELNCEEEVEKFAKSLLAMYYYEHQSFVKEKKIEEFNLSLNRTASVNTPNKNGNLKDAIKKLNNL